jgi:hypothetical protein
MVRSEHRDPYVFPFQFLVYYPVFWFFSCEAEVSLSRWLCWFIVGILRATYLLTCWSASPMQVWSWNLAVQEPYCFLSVMWCAEALYELVVRGVGIFAILGVFFLPSVAPASQQNS